MTTPIASPGEITLGVLDLNTVTDEGVQWAFETIDGWHDGPGVTVDQSQRIASHGQFAQNGHRTGRTITVGGWIGSLTDDRAQVASAVQALASVLADGGFSRFTFTDDDTGQLWADVQLLDRPAIDWTINEFARFQLQLLAPDPYRYGATSTASTPFAATPEGSGMVFDLFPGGVMDFGVLGSVGSASVTNDGTAPAAVVFSIVGPAPPGGFKITDTATGDTINYLGDLPAGSTLVMDGGDGSVTIDGTADRRGDTIVTSWPSVPAGSSRSFLFEPIGSSSAAVLTVSSVSTYW